MSTTLRLLLLPLALVLGREVVRRRTAARPTSVLLVTLDTLRADALGSYGGRTGATPLMDRLAETGVRFAQASTVMPLTLPAHASLLTGTFPAFHGVRDNGGFYLGDQHETLAEILKSNGYRTGAFVASFIMSEVIAISGVIWSTEMGYVIAFVVFVVMIFVRPGGILARRQ